MRLGALAIVAGLAVSTMAAEAPKERIPVFIKGSQADGFTDPSKDRQDSIKDLAKLFVEQRIIDSVCWFLVQTLFLSNFFWYFLRTGQSAAAA